MDLGLKGKTVIVTGGGSNIGRAVALTLAGEGANVVIAELDEVQGNKVATEAGALKAGGQTVTMKTDVTDVASVENTVKKTLEKFGKIITVNYKSVLTCVKAVLPHMIEQNSGSIVSLGSDAGRMGDAREAVYAGTKGAIMSFTKAVARENGRFGIRMNVVCPGATVPAKAEDIGEQSMWKLGFDFFTPELKEKWAKTYALRRLGTPQEVANAVVFLASDAASFITGQTLSASGGYSMM
jgi:NAD(P)-dependent dehydrogenase (short-subunit alcohol dehydrogenase family)